MGPVSGADARRAAQQELSRGEYHRDDPSLLNRAVTWFFDHLDRLGEASTGQSALVVVAVILIVVVGFMIVRAGRPIRSRRSGAVDADPLGALGGIDHARAAQDHFDAGRYAEALQGWLRVIVGDLERRGLLDARPGRTADDIARIGGARLPEAAPALLAATDAFDAIWFGARPATAADAVAGRDAVLAVRQARAQSGVAVAAGYAVPQ